MDSRDAPLMSLVTLILMTLIVESWNVCVRPIVGCSTYSSQLSSSTGVTHLSLVGTRSLVVSIPAYQADPVIIYLTVIIGSHTCFRFAVPGGWSWGTTSRSHFMPLSGLSVNNCRGFVQHADPSSTGFVYHALVYSCTELLEFGFFLKHLL